MRKTAGRTAPFFLITTIWLTIAAEQHIWAALLGGLAAVVTVYLVIYAAGSDAA